MDYRAMPDRSESSSSCIAPHIRCQGVRHASNSPAVSAQVTPLQLISLPGGPGLNTSSQGSTTVPAIPQTLAPAVAQPSFPRRFLRMEQDFLQQTEHHSQSSQGFEDLPDVKVYADSISSPGDSGVLSCNNSIYSSSGFTPCTPGSTPDVNSNPACSSESRHQFGMNKEHGMSTESVSATSGSPTPSPEEGTFEMPRPFILPSDAAAAASANQQQAHPSAFKPYLPKPLVLPNTLQELTMPSTRSSTDSDPRGHSNPESISSNHSSGRNSIINSLRNSMASSESSNYSIVSEHSNLSAGQDSQQFLQQNTLRDTDSDSFSASLTPTARMKKYEDSGRRNSVPSVGSSPTSLTVRPKTGSQTQTPVSECSGTRFRPQSAKTNYDMCVLCDKQCNNFLMHEWRRQCVTCGCPSSGHMAQQVHMNKVINHLFNDGGIQAPQKQSISSLSDTDSGCYVMEDYAWVPAGLNPKQVQLYFATILPYKVPYVNSVGEQYRACQLVTQLPVHDILPRAGAPRDEQSNLAFTEFSRERRQFALGRGIAKQLTIDQFAVPCAKCQGPINGGEIAVTAIRAGTNKMWHPGCFVCNVCNELLVDLIYFFHQNDAQLYCGRHHAELARPRCCGCDEIIFSSEYTQCGKPGQNWHVNHFCCSECETTLTGGKYVMQGNHPYCPSCYDSLFAYTCALCHQVIGAEDTQVTYQDQHWHANKEGCFNCHNCGKNLVGLPFIPKIGIIFCSQSCKKGEIPTSPLLDNANNPSPDSFRNLKSNFPPLVPPIVKPTFTGLPAPGSNHSSNNSSPSIGAKNKSRNPGARNSSNTPPKSVSQSLDDTVKLSMHLGQDGCLMKDEDYDSALSSCHSSTLDSPQNGTLLSLDKPPPLPPKPSFMRGGSQLERIQEQHYVDKFSETLENVMELTSPGSGDTPPDVYFERATVIDSDHVYAEPRRQSNASSRPSSASNPPRSMPDLSKSGRKKSILKEDAKPAAIEPAETLSNSAKNVSFNPEIAERARSNSLTRSEDSRTEINSGAFSDSEDFNFSKMRGTRELKHRKDLLKAVARNFTKEELEEYLGHRASRTRNRNRRHEDGFRQRIDCYDSDSSSSSSDDDGEDCYWAPASLTSTRPQNIYYNHTPSRSAMMNAQRKKRSSASKKNSCKIS